MDAGSESDKEVVKSGSSGFRITQLSGLDNADEDAGDIIATTRVVGGGNQVLADFIKVMRVAQHVRDAGVGEFAGKTVAAEQKQITRGDFECADFRGYGTLRADRPGDDVTQWGAVSFLAGELAELDLFVNQGVVVGELFENAVAIAIAAAVPDVGDPDFLLLGEEGDESGTHSVEAGIVGGLREDEMIGVSDGFAEKGGNAHVIRGPVAWDAGVGVAFRRWQILGRFRLRGGCFWLGRLRPAAAEVAKHGVDSDAAGNFASGGPTHTIADDKQTFFGADTKGIFIGRTNPTAMRGGGSLVTVLTELRHAESTP